MNKFEISSFKAFGDDAVVFDSPTTNTSSKNILCYGENGAGKSSIFEAFRFFFFWERIKREKILSTIIGEERKNAEQQLAESYRNEKSKQPCSVMINGQTRDKFCHEDYEAYLVCGKDLRTDDSIDIKVLLERCYLTESIASNLTREKASSIVDSVNRTLQEYFYYSAIILGPSQEEGFKIFIQDSIRGLRKSHPLGEYFNEALLNIISLLIVLSAIKDGASSERKRILVLDDVFSSIDMSNRSFLYRYITGEFEDFQLIILTHSTSFFNLFEYHINRESRKDNWEIFRLYEHQGRHKLFRHRWTTTKDLKEDLGKTSSDIECIGNRIRQLFEDYVYLLGDLTTSGARQEVDKLIEDIIQGDKKKHYSFGVKKIETTLELVAKIREYINNADEDEKIEKIKKAVECFDKEQPPESLSNLLREMRIYQKSSLHPSSHGGQGIPNIAKSEFSASLCILEKLEKLINKLSVGKI